MKGLRSLHFVLKVGNLKKNIKFFRDKLGMTVLRHEVFDKGCEAACNGPYDTKWSKTMIGYGPEDSHFVLELTYNYTTGSYKRGNDLKYIKIKLDQDRYKRLIEKESGVSVTDDGAISINSPDGYNFLVVTNTPVREDIREVCLSCTNLGKSLDFWHRLLKMELIGGSSDVRLSYDTNVFELRLLEIKEPMDHGSAYGRIAFSCPSEDLKPIQKSVEEAGHKVLTPYLSLDTPGKATVQVVIVADPDGHEICFVGDEGFRELSQVDMEADALIEKSMAEDKSDEWFEKKNQSKKEG